MSMRAAVRRTTAQARFTARPAFFVLAFGFLTFSTRAADPEFSWVPVDASAPYTTAQPDSAGEDTEIILSGFGTDRIVEFEIRLNGWGSAPGAPTLHVTQAFVDAAGFLGANAVPANPGVDLSPLNNQAWRVNPGGNGSYDGVFISLETCHDAGGANIGPRCATYPAMTLDACPPGTTCSDNDDFVFFGNLSVVAVATSTANYAWGAVSVTAQCTPDAGGSYYLGTLVLNVPAGATGTYTIGFDSSVASTFMVDCIGATIQNPILTPGRVTGRESGRCCSGPPQFSCEEDVLPEDCTGPNQSFELGTRCTDPPSCNCFPDCAVDQDCDDNNACTVDACSLATCRCEHHPTYNEIAECCDPATGNITIIDDGDDCTVDMCNIITGQVSHTAFCEDGNACTDDICLPGGSCNNPLNYNPATECCNPSSGVVSQLDDGEVCTDDSCDSLTGLVSHLPICPEFSWVPVDASVPFTTDRPDGAGVDTRIITSVSASDEIVEFEIRINGWANGPGTRTLHIAQATVDAGGFLGVNATPPNPGVDLSPLNNQAWRVNPGGNGQDDGAFIVLETCHTAGMVNVGPRCLTEPPMALDACPPGTSCSDNDDFAFFGNVLVAATSVASSSYAWGALSNIGQCTTDNGGSYYLGTLVLSVPAGAVGTYSFDFAPDPAQTFLVDCTDAAFQDAILTPGQVTVGTVAAPRTAPFPHDRRKNRYISFDPNKAENDGSSIAFKVGIKSITLGSCDGATGGRVDFCREDRKECSGSGDPCTSDGDCGVGKTCVSTDCNACSSDGNACVSQPIDCLPGQTCEATGENCVNDTPDSGGSNVGLIWWVGPSKNTVPVEPSVHLLVSQAFRHVSTNWPNPTHAGDCEVVPEAVYGVRAVNVGSGIESAELDVTTALYAPISSSWWGDCVGPLKRFCGGDIRTPECSSDADCPAPQTCDQAWTLPDGAVNFDDIGAGLALVAPGPNSTPPDMTWVDLHGNASGAPGSHTIDPPNFVANFSDIQQILSAFGGFPYKFYDPADCPDVPDWP